MTNHYLNPYEQVTQVYLHQFALVLVLIILKIFFFTKTLVSSLNFANQQSLTLCNLANTYSNNLANLPNKLSLVTNGLISSFLSSFESQCKQFVTIILKIVKNLIIFYIDIYLGTYTCLLSASIHGTLNFVQNTITSIAHSVNTSVNAIITELQSGLGEVSSIINTVLKSYQSIKTLFSSKPDDITSSISSVNLTISNLNHINISATSVVSDINDLNDNLPDFKNLTSKTIDFITAPFSDILVNITSLNNTSKSLPTIKSASLTQICSPSEISHFYTKINATITKTSNYIIIGLSILLFSFLILLSYIQFHKYNRFLTLIDKIALANHHVQIGNLINTYSNPLLYNLENFSFFKTLQDSVHWFLSYIFSPLALTPLLISLAGLITVGLQFLILRISSNHLSAITFNTLADLSQSTSKYVNDVNRFLLEEQDDMNNQLFGGILDITESLNNTLSNFMDDLTTTINTIFGKTPLSSPLNTIVYCTIGKKIELFEKGANWLNENLNLSLPIIPSSEFSSLLKRSENTVDDILDSMNSSIQSLISSYKKSLSLELYILLGFLGIWILQVLIGLFILMIKAKSTKRPKSDAFLESPQETKQETHHKTISNPIPLSDLEKHRYGYPFINPFDLEIADSSSSSKYSQSISSTHK